MRTSHERYGWTASIDADIDENFSQQSLHEFFLVDSRRIGDHIPCAFGLIADRSDAVVRSVASLEFEPTTTPSTTIHTLRTLVCPYMVCTSVGGI